MTSCQSFLGNKQLLRLGDFSKNLLSLTKDYFWYHINIEAHFMPKNHYTHAEFNTEIITGCVISWQKVGFNIDMLISEMFNLRLSKEFSMSLLELMGRNIQQLHQKLVNSFVT